MPKRALSLLLCFSLILIAFSAIPQNNAMAASNYSGPYVKVGDVTLPLAEHMPGTFFTRDGKACTCHATADCISNESDCNCMRYYPTGNKDTCEIDLLSVQCFGFARLVFYKCFGFIDHSMNSSKYYNVGTLSRSQVNATSVKNLLMKAATGAHVRLARGHSVSILTMDEDFLVIYHGNSGGDGVASASCVVSTRRYTWAEFAEYASAGILYVNMPYNYPGSSVVVSDKKIGHYRITSDTGLRLRAEANTECETYSVIPFETIIQVTEINGLWGKTTYNGKTGWVFLEYTVYYSALEIIPSSSNMKMGNDGYLRATMWEMDLNAFSEHFDKQSLVITDSAGNKIQSGALIGTGAKISLVVDGKSYDTATVCIAGDVNSNGRIDVGDYLVLRRAYFSTFDLTDAQSKAADVNGNGKIDSTDYVLVRRYFYSMNPILFKEFLG